MWNNEKQQRFDALRLKEAQGILNNGEIQELQAFFAELEAEEVETFRQGMERMDARRDSLRAEKAHTKARNKQLAAIVAKQEQLLAEARNYLTHLRRKRAELHAEYHAATGKELAT